MAEWEKFPSFNWFPTDWIGGTAELSAEQKGVFADLLSYAWEQTPPCTLPDNEVVLAKLGGIPLARWRKIGQPILDKFEKTDDGRLRNRKLYSVYLNMCEMRQRRQKAGSTGGKAKAKGKQISSNATAMPKHPDPYPLDESKDSSLTPKRASWVAPYAAAWIERFGGTAPAGRIGKAVKPLVKQYGDVPVQEAWKAYLEAVEPDYAAPETFASKYGVWSGSVRPSANLDNELTDVKMLIKAAGTMVFNAFTRDEGFKKMAQDYPAAWRRLESVMRSIRYGDLKDAAEAKNGIEYTNLLRGQLREIQDAA
jgi:uncharacterized protein YdaU (DUF1376 family)